MRFEKIVLKNYRQFKDTKILFKENISQDLNFLIGKNGTGKTNLLNAINWCLYGKEPHLSKTSQQLPRFNLINVKNNSVDVIVQLSVLIENRDNVIFTRKESYRLNKNNQPVLQGENFEVEYTDSLGNRKTYIEDEAIKQVNRFVPLNIREYFFFDGEMLDNYFKAKSKHIKEATLEISRIDILSKIERHLNSIVKDLSKQAGDKNPEVEKTRLKIEENKQKIEKNRESLLQLQSQIELAEAKIEKIVQELMGTPDIESQENKRQKLINKIGEQENDLKDYLKSKDDILFDYGKIIMLWDAIQNSISIINKGRKEKKVPPPIEIEVIEDSINNEECEICGRTLDVPSKEYLEDLVQKINFASDIGDQLKEMTIPLKNFNSKINNFEKDISRINKSIKDTENNLKENNLELDEINKFMDKFDVKRIGDLNKQRKNYEISVKNNGIKMGSLNNELELLEKMKKQLNQDLSDQLDEEIALEGLKRKYNFASKALNVAVSAKGNIIEETRIRIESKTKEFFFNLLWKKETFNDVLIDDSYNINLIHHLGYECLGSVSAAERELLALSFTLALHEISGFDSPIIIDTPVARVSDEHRENFGKIFEEISKRKQIILLFTPAEYSKEIRNLFEDKTENKFVIQMADDESEVKIEGM